MNNKHQPCGKPGCINCWAPATGFNGQAQQNNPWRNTEGDPLTQEQMLGMMNDSRIRDAQRHMNINTARMIDSVDDRVIGDYPPVIWPLLKLILRQMAYFLFLMLLIAFGWAVFHG